MTDCGGHVMASGNCSCETERCDSCGARFHYDSDQLRDCDQYGKLCRGCHYTCNGECCMPAECFDGRDR